MTIQILYMQEMKNNDDMVVDNNINKKKFLGYIIGKMLND